jgi:mannose-6-phosphate isomerase-like protein (cupin superfamily)
MTVQEESSTTSGTYQLYNIREPYLGFKDHRAASDLMTIKLKKYETGGENRRHRHLGEDHCFVILEGEATFHLDLDDKVHVLGEGDGILLPLGTFYWFENTGDQDLVIYRVGALDRTKPQHAVFDDDSVKTGRKD